jgi:hypothetical protein
MGRAEKTERERASDQELPGKHCRHSVNLTVAACWQKRRPAASAPLRGL